MCEIGVYGEIRRALRGDWLWILPLALVTYELRIRCVVGYFRGRVFKEETYGQYSI